MALTALNCAGLGGVSTQMYVDPADVTCYDPSANNIFFKSGLSVRCLDDVATVKSALGIQ